MVTAEIPPPEKSEPETIATPPSDTVVPDDLLLQDEHIKTTGNVESDGRVNICIFQKSSKLLSQLVQPRVHRAASIKSNEETLPTWLTDEQGPTPPMNIVIQIVGSRGDVQPFIALGKNLKEKHGHRVRLATHAVFKNFVEENGLEFFNIGGDPAGLMDYMVKNPGLIPGTESLKHGDVSKRKKEIAEILVGCWRSCIEAGDGMDNTEYREEDSARWRPFVANAIIANPPGFAHFSCAEKLGIPFHLMFTMPWTPTTAFPHPLANIKSTDTDPRVTNFVSYSLVQLLTWQGLGPVINEFREEVLGLEPCSVLWMPVLIQNAKVPFTYCWSPALIPKPPDWANHIHVAGFFFLGLASAFTPDLKLLEFLQAGPPPVYIGFGSIVVEDPNAMTEIIFQAVKKAGVRALISKGWGGFGGDDLKVPENVYMLGNVPHDWLFKHVSAVCHHGGAGTTAAGIALGRPTIVVPFFGDQPFWGSMIHRAGAGPPPIPHKQLDADKLADAIAHCLKDETQAAAGRMAEQIKQEKGPEIGSDHFHAMLPMDRLRCAIDPQQVAVWRVKHTNIRIGALAAAVLLEQGLLRTEDLKLNRTREYDVSFQPWDPVSGAVSALVGNLSNFMVGTASLPSDITKAFKLRKRATGNLNESGDALSRSSTDLSDSRPPSLYSTHSQTRKHGSYAHDAASVVRKDWVHLLTIPKEMILGLAKGFHNAPKLYHDRTVRQPDKVTNLRSGLKGAGKEFGLELYDAVTGVVTQPYNGAKEDGVLGFLKGAGKGLGGLLLKPEAAVLGAIGYTMEGFYKSAQVHLREKQDHSRGSGLTIDERVAASWIIEGYSALASATDEQKSRVVLRWHEIQAGEQAEKQEKLAHRPSWRPGSNHGHSHGGGIFSRSSTSVRSKESVERHERHDSLREPSPVEDKASRDGFRLSGEKDETVA
ncbi:hypothetical protein BCR34DRAFT_572560 [Clohesyomyces aquaticus]|uniref:Uncharacterized protein n=1 Tax=Clohesyomyces aquaticus TaxID=1231657 RepID=A0A1Y1Z2M5_9PLEO|nr:hypothetical protein BCR34DRAFT_572560 [Clohesyomyces aquaticus]